MEYKEAEQGFTHFKIHLDAKNLERDLSNPWTAPTFPAAQLFRSPRRHGTAQLELITTDLMGIPGKLHGILDLQGENQDCKPGIYSLFPNPASSCP